MIKMKISASQAVILLFLCRMFGSITYSPSFTNTMEGTAILLADLIAVFCTLITLIPLFLLFRKKPELRPLGESLSINGVFGKIICCYLLLLMILAAADTVSHFTFFMKNAVFPDASSLLLTTTFLLACLYGACMGLEGLSRSAGIVFFFFLLSTLFILLSARENIDFINLKPLVHTKWSDIADMVLHNLSHNTEYILLFLLYPHVKGRFLSVSLGFWAASSIGILFIGTVTVLILGDFTAKQLFPFYTVASIVNMGVLQRLDSIHMFLWVLVAYIRASLYLAVAGLLLKSLFSGKAFSEKSAFYAPVLPAIAVWGICFFLSKSLHPFESLFSTLLPVLLTIIILPLILLIHLYRKKPSCRKGEVDG